MANIWEPKYEGIDHINVYSKSKLPLGRALSNFFRSNFNHPQHGKFASVEGYYYWLLSGEMYEDLREHHGFIAKRYGMNLPVVRRVDKLFKSQIQQAIAYKIIQNSYIQDLLVKSDLPLAHYYYYGDAMHEPKIVDRHKEHGYMIHAIEEIRINLKRNGKIIKSNN